MKKFVITLLLLYKGVSFASYPLILPSQAGKAGQVLALTDESGNLDWLTTLTHASLANLVITATWADKPLTLVLRDSTGSFDATNITLNGTAAIAGNLLVSGSVAGSVFYEFPAPIADSPAATTVQKKLNNVVYLQDFGGVGDGVTNNYAPLQNALSYLSIQGGGTLYIPAGEYIYNLTGQYGMYLGAPNIHLKGDGMGKTTIILTTTQAKQISFFTIASNNISFQDLSLTISAFPASQNAFIVSSYGFKNVTLRNVEFNGGYTNSGSLPYGAYAWGFPSGNYIENNLIFNGCLFQNINAFLKPNTASSIQQGISIVNCQFDGIGAGVGLNSPLGSQSQILVANNTISNLFEGIGIQIASGNDITIVNNYIDCSGQNGCMHIENNVLNFVIQGNQILTNQGTGIILLANNIGDSSYLMPQYGIIQGNNFIFTGTAPVPNCVGINISYDTHPQPAQNIIVADNIITGSWVIGIQDGAGISSMCLVRNNQVIGALTGYNIVDGGFSFDQNVSSNCTLGFQGKSASVNRHIFHDCITTMSADYQPLVMRNSIIEFDAETITTGTTNFDLLRIGANDRLSAIGKIYVRSTANSTALSARQENMVWDGTILTITPQIAYEPGAFTTGFVQDAATGMLALQVYSSAPYSNVLMEVSLDGMYAMSE